jgi:hypothetical protein
MLRSSKGLLTVESLVPYSGAMVGWLHLYGLPLQTLEAPSRWYERAFLAWEMVRRVRNPFFSEGTGFEGYYIGLCATAEQMTDALLQLGHTMLTHNQQLYPHDTLFHDRLLWALTGENDDPEALLVWSAELGATLGRLRAWAASRPAAGSFQSETYRMTNTLPALQYTLANGRIAQTYTLPYPSTAQTHKLDITPASLHPADYEAAVVVWSVGKLGHPLVRQYLSARTAAISPGGRLPATG